MIKLQYMQRWPFVCIALALSIAPLNSRALPEQSNNVSQTEMQAMLERVRAYADEYVTKLPDFICEQVIKHSSTGKKAERWRTGDTLTTRLIFAGGQEKRTVEAVNGKSVTQARRVGARQALTTEGEFGILLANILGPNSSAEIKWGGIEKMRERDVAVFRYSIAREDSTLTLTLSDLARATLPYYGEVYADAATGTVLRIVKHVSEIPSELKTKDLLTVIDYDKAQIGATSYFLPSVASVVVRTDSGQLKNEMFFSHYQKFETNSTITFQP